MPLHYWELYCKSQCHSVELQLDNSALVIMSLICFDLFQVHIQNSTLAGGVAVGTAAEFMLTPYGALIVGFFCGIISTLGYIYLSPFLERKLKIQDSCGVHNLHAMPGVIGGIVGAISAAGATESVYGLQGLKDTFDFTGAFANRTPAAQGGFQAAAMCVSICFGIGGGIFVGLILRMPLWGDPTDDKCFDDVIYWELPDEEEEPVEADLHYNNHTVANNHVEVTETRFTVDQQ